MQPIQSLPRAEYADLEMRRPSYPPSELSNASGSKELFAGEPCRIVRGEENSDECDVAYLTGAAQRGVSDGGFFEVGADYAAGVGAFGLNRAGVDDVDADLPGPELAREDAGDGVKSGLGAGVNRGVWAACVVRIAPSTFMLKLLWKCSSVIASIGANSRRPCNSLATGFGDIGDYGVRASLAGGIVDDDGCAF